MGLSEMIVLELFCILEIFYQIFYRSVKDRNAVFPNTSINSFFDILTSVAACPEVSLPSSYSFAANDIITSSSFRLIWYI